MNGSPPRWLFLLPALMMLLALADMPYGYYQVLRIVTFLAAGAIAFYAWQHGREGWAIAFAMLAIVFNPLIPVALERDNWAVVNVVAAVGLLAGLLASRKWLTADDAKIAH